VQAVRFSRSHGMKVAVRGGGHSWVGFSLRNGGLLIDLARLNRISIDKDARVAQVQPGVKGRELMHQLVPLGLAFPVGHAPTVPLSGFLLNGGLGWNFNKWGPGCFSVEAARVVLADGSVVLADHEHDAELLWAVRGAGPGFFGVVIEYLLKLYPAPGAIRASTYFYPLRRVKDAGTWAASVAPLMPPEVELTLFVAPAPPSLAEQCQSSNGYVAILNATAFLDTEREAAAALGLLENGPLAGDCLYKEVNQPVTFDGLLDMGGTLWPERHRYRVDTVWSNSAPKLPLAAVQDAFLQAPSSRSLALCVISTGGENRGAWTPDGVFSMTAETLFLCYAIWEAPEQDEANATWHRQLIAALDSFAIGHYVGESDIVANPGRAERSFAPAQWQRLQSLRRKYDPDQLFHEHFEDDAKKEALTSAGRPNQLVEK
jgi:FAD/FMN-containing dehydrogenase